MNPPGSSLTSIESIVNSHKEYGKEQLGHYKRYVREHIDFSTYCINRALKCEQQIDMLLLRLSNPPETLDDLINQIYPLPNHKHQYDTLKKLSKYDGWNCTKYEKNTATSRRLADVEGTFKVQGEEEKEYNVKLFKQGTNEKGSFSCNCPDHTFNSKKKNIVCKHICYVVCKMANILDISYFESKQLTQEQFEKVLNVRVARPVPLFATGTMLESA